MSRAPVGALHAPLPACPCAILQTLRSTVKRIFLLVLILEAFLVGGGWAELLYLSRDPREIRGRSAGHEEQVGSKGWLGLSHEV